MKEHIKLYNVNLSYYEFNLVGIQEERRIELSEFCQNQIKDSAQLEHLFVRFQKVLNWMTSRKQRINENLTLPPQRCSKYSLTTQWNQNLST
jgi:hypothetical protein